MAETATGSIADVQAIELEICGAQVRFTGRSGGVSDGCYSSLNLSPHTGDRPAAVAENRARAADGRPLVAVQQVHGATVVTLTSTGPGRQDEADGLVTAEHGVAAVVLTADCLPVALATPQAIGIVHAGWRGLLAGVLEAGVRAIRSLDPEGRLEAAIGPGAGACCYGVGPEVAEQLPHWALAHGRADLKAVATHTLEDAGAIVVHDVGRCTICEPQSYFSHRMSGPVTGRQGGLIWRS